MLHQDITDYKLTAFKQRETYISTINHDLKIPTLAQIRALELLADESLGKLNDKQKEIVNLTLESCRTMYEMMSAILDCFKLENKDIVLDIKNIDIIRVINECFILFKNNFKQKNINAVIKNEYNKLNIKADLEQIKKAIGYIIEYCVSCANKNTDILCKTGFKQNNILISISFTNPYMKPNNPEKMLRKYTTPDEKLDKLGTNLRLYLTKQIIDAHSGHFFINFKNGRFICEIVIPV